MYSIINQGAKIWYLCYHSSKYPATTFSHIDSPVSTSRSKRSQSFQEQPRANSTLRDHSPVCKTGPCSKNSSNLLNSSGKHSLVNNSQGHSGCQSAECSSYNVGHISHIPRTPPTPATYTIPSIGHNTECNGTKVNETQYTCGPEEDLFGMIKLAENDVCYTSGTIEWVGRKRSFPINSGFKLINECQKQCNEPLLKKAKRLDKTFTCNVSNNMKDCECADVLPTVNAIVDHLNALHEAVDLVDLRVNTLEDTLCKDE